MLIRPEDRRIAFIILGSPEQKSGGYRYDRKLQNYLTTKGLSCDFLSIDKIHERKRLKQYNTVIIDGLCHRAAWSYKKLFRHCEIFVLIHHLQSSEGRGVLRNFLDYGSERRFLLLTENLITTNSIIQLECEKLRGQPFKSVVLAPPSLDWSSDTFKSAKKAAPGGSLQVLFVANIIPRKGLHVLLSALHKIDISWELTIAGSESWNPIYARSIKRRCNRLRRQRKASINMLGHVTEDRLHQLYKQSDVLAVPSSYEGFGMVYLEAMAHGTVVLASAHGGAGSFIEDGENGFLVEFGDKKRIRALLRSIRTDEQLRKRISEKAKETAFLLPDWDSSFSAIADRLINVVP